MKKVLLPALAGLVIWIASDAVYRYFQPPHCNVIHEPKGGCPNGYVREKLPRFTERDGSKEFACVSHEPGKSGCIDELRSGESVNMEITLHSIQ